MVPAAHASTCSYAIGTGWSHAPVTFRRTDQCTVLFIQLLIGCRRCLHSHKCADAEVAEDHAYKYQQDANRNNEASAVTTLLAREARKHQRDACADKQRGH